MGFKMNGPSLYKPKMADMDIQKNYAKKSDDRAMSSPYQLNTGADTKVKEAKKTEVHDMFGQLNDKGTKIINEQGNWVSLTKGSEGAAVRTRATKAGKISGGPGK